MEPSAGLGKLLIELKVPSFWNQIVQPPSTLSAFHLHAMSSNECCFENKLCALWAYYFRESRKTCGKACLVWGRMCSHAKPWPGCRGWWRWTMPYLATENMKIFVNVMRGCRWEWLGMMPHATAVQDSWARIIDDLCLAWYFSTPIHLHLLGCRG